MSNACRRGLACHPKAVQSTERPVYSSRPEAWMVDGAGRVPGVDAKDRSACKTERNVSRQRCAEALKPPENPTPSPRRHPVVIASDAHGPAATTTAAAGGFETASRSREAAKARDGYARWRPRPVRRRDLPHTRPPSPVAPRLAAIGRGSDFAWAREACDGRGQRQN